MIPAALHAQAEAYRRPSSLAAIALCEGRPVMEARVVELEGEPQASEEADLGTELHAFAQAAIESWKLGGSWGDIIAAACNQAASEGVDSWSVACLQRALEAVRNLIDRHGVEPEHVLTEHALDMAPVGFQRKGTADLVLVVPFKLVVVVDFKFGFIDQGEADTHDQTQAYAAAAAVTFQVPRVEVYLIQPRARGNEVSGAIYDADTLRKNAAWTAAVLRLSRANNPRLTAGYDQCLYCRALPRCAEARRFIMEASEALSLIGEPLDADGLGDLAAAAKLAEEFAERGKELAKRALVAGRPVTGWKLDAPRAVRSVATPAVAIRKLEAVGITTAALAEVDAITFKVAKLPPEAEEVIADHITEKLSAPPMTRDKASRKAGAA